MKMFPVSEVELVELSLLVEQLNEFVPFKLQQLKQRYEVLQCNRSAWLNLFSWEFKTTHTALQQFYKFKWEFERAKEYVNNRDKFASIPLNVTPTFISKCWELVQEDINSNFSPFKSNQNLI